MAKCARRLGKTYCLMAYAVERCLNNRHARIPFAAPTYKDLKNILIPIVRDISKDSPSQCRPELKISENCFIFPNGSQIAMAGVNGGNAEQLRGKEALDCIVDEAGFIDDLMYLVNDILMPQLLYSPTGKLILSSTPPISPAHAFVHFIAEAEGAGSLIHKTIYDNPRLTPETIAEYAKEAGCIVVDGVIVEESTTWQREYLARVITDATSAVVPEFTDRRALELVKEWPRPELFHSYVFMDTGFIDFTAAIFLYYDFRAAKIIVEDELVIDVRQEKKNSEFIAKMIRLKETQLWGDKEPYARFADGDLSLLNDYSSIHNLAFTPVTDKDALEAQVNNLRLDIQAGNVIINPKCTNTIAHLKYATYDKSRRKLERAENMGHFDCLMALVYAVRHVNRSLNPYPATWNVDVYNSFIRPNFGESKHRQEFRKLLRN